MGVTSNVGKWNRYNDGPPSPYGDTSTYYMAAEAVKDCATVEDWGAGRCFLADIVGQDRYIAVDGSASPTTVKVVDLADYRSQADGIILRHVLEHDWRWKDILRNALDSFTKVLVIVLFTPWSDGETKDIQIPGDHPEIECPDLSFNRTEFMEAFGPYPEEYSIEVKSDLKTRTVFGVEHFIVVRRA